MCPNCLEKLRGESVGIEMEEMFGDVFEVVVRIDDLIDDDLDGFGLG